jgi:CBS domain-containing protein
LPITSALTTDVLTVPPDATVSELVNVHVLGRRERSVPVVDGGRYVGMCGLDEVGAVERRDWDATTLDAVLAPEHPVGRPSWTLRDAVAAMERAGVDVLPVTDSEGTFIGVVQSSEIVKLDEILDETGG